jgi:hypothetical protein
VKNSLEKAARDPKMQSRGVVHCLFVLWLVIHSREVVTVECLNGYRKKPG